VDGSQHTLVGRDTQPRLASTEIEESAWKTLLGARETLATVDVSVSQLEDRLGLTLVAPSDEPSQVPGPTTQTHPKSNLFVFADELLETLRRLGSRIDAIRARVDL